MLHATLSFEDGSSQPLQASLPLDVGRTPGCGLRLRGWRVAKLHARFEERHGGVFLEDYGALSGTVVNGQRIAQYGPLLVGDEIIIGPCLIRILQLTNNDEPELPINPAQILPTALASDLLDATCAVVIQEADVASDAYSNLDLRLQHHRRLYGVLLKELDLRRRDIANISDQALRGIATQVMNDIMAKDQELPAELNRQQLLEDVVNEAVGLGPLERLLADPSISEIMVNRHDEVFIESAGKLQRSATVFSSEQAVLSVIERIVAPLGRRVDESSPMVDARLRDGSRVNAVIPPVALRGASLTIRKFPQQRPCMVDLVGIGALDSAMCDFLLACVQHKKNLIVSGGTGSGKTTLLNILSNAIPVGERIVTIEDAAELRLDHAHLVALESRPANLEGRGKIEIRDLVRNALRMRPDRIIIGECRGGEAFDMLAAMNTGHEGSLTTLHANSPRDALARLETMILMAGMDLPLSAVREHIASSINIIVQQMRLSTGRRLLTSIVEVTGMESGRIQTQELFRYQSGPQAAFVGCGIIPDCFYNVSTQINLTAELFNQHTPLPESRNDFSHLAAQAGS